MVRPRCNGHDSRQGEKQGKGQEGGTKRRGKGRPSLIPTRRRRHSPSPSFQTTRRIPPEAGGYAKAKGSAMLSLSTVRTHQSLLPAESKERDHQSGPTHPRRRHHGGGSSQRHTKADWGTVRRSKRAHTEDSVEEGGFSGRLNPTAWVRAFRCNNVFITRFRSMKVPTAINTRYNTAEIKSLVDSGATHNFVHPRFVRRMKIGMQRLQTAKTLYNVDDTTNKDGKITHYLVLNVQTKGKSRRMTFLVAEIGKEDIILGYPWLAAYEPQFDWAKGTLNGEYHPLILSSTVPDNQIPTIGALQLRDKEKILGQLESECRGRSIATDLARSKAGTKETTIIPKEYQDFASVFSEEEAERFPPSRPWDHAIDLKPNAPDQISCQVYPMTPLEDQVLDDFIDEQLAKGYIHPSISPYASSFFFIKKKDDKLRPVQDYQTINKWTVRNQYPLPLIPTLIYDLGGAHIYTKLDVRWGYNNVRIKKGDEWKAAFKTRRGLYEPTVMFFGLTNSPATFQAMMNHIYRNTIIKHEALGTIIRVYMDDIAIATKTPSLAAHTNAVRDVLQVAKEQSLYFKLSKCTFHATSIDYLGVILEKGVTRMDPVKVAGIQTWPTPKSVREVRSFHGFCNFYRPFIAGFAKIALPLNKLTKKDTPFVWTPECQKAFETLKRRVTSEPVLAHPDLTKQFELEVDASGYAVGAVLLQRQVDNKRHPIGYYSATLTSAERNYDIYDLELLAIVKALRNWRPFLAGSPHKVKIFSDHMNLQYWRDPRKISRQVAREVLELADYDYEIHHLKGKSNGRADALSRRPDYDQGERDNENITVLPKQVWARQTSAETEGQDEGTIRRWIDPHHLKQIKGRWEKAGRKVITGDEEEQRRLVRNHHDPPAYGHPGIQKTVDLVQRHYWWPTLKKDVVQFVKGCGECQRNKVNTRPEKAALSPIFPIPNARPFEVVALDFITKLPKSRHYDSILTVTDHDRSEERR